MEKSSQPPHDAFFDNNEADFYKDLAQTLKESDAQDEENRTWWRWFTVMFLFMVFAVIVIYVMYKMRK